MRRCTAGRSRATRWSGRCVGRSVRRDHAVRRGAECSGPADRAVYTSAMNFARVVLGLCVVAVLAPTIAGAQDSFKALDLIKPARAQTAKDFVAPSPDGKPVKLADYRGKAILLNFWATWCPPCREEMPAMERLFQRYKDTGLMVLAESVDWDIVVVPPFVRQNKLTFPIGHDPKMALAERYGVRAF